MDNLTMLKKADELACEMINLLKHGRGCDLPMAFMTTAVMFGRLRLDAKIQGANLEEIDDLFRLNAQIITKNVEEDENGS